MFYEVVSLPLNPQPRHIETNVYLFHLCKSLPTDPQKPQIAKPYKPSTIKREGRSPVYMTVTDSLKAFTFTTVTIECTSTGIPTPTISWSLNGEPLITGDRHVIYNNGTLVIHNTTKSDEGKYSCTAKNIEGEDSESANVAITGNGNFIPKQQNLS